MSNFLRLACKSFLACFLAIALSAWGPWMLERIIAADDDGTTDNHELGTDTADDNMEAPDEGSC